MLPLQLWHSSQVSLSAVTYGQTILVKKSVVKLVIKVDLSVIEENDGSRTIRSLRMVYNSIIDQLAEVVVGFC